MRKIITRLAEDLEKIREEKPLLHHITNYVVANETANLTLCVGALPVMAQDQKEVEEMVSHAGALILNIGTLSLELVEAMILAGKRANELKIPIVFDPVGVGATSLRTESARKILRELYVDIIRGNAAEVSILAGYGGKIRGVESLGVENDLSLSIKEFAFKKNCIVAATGEEDLINDGKRLAIVKNGHPMLNRVTGTGCMATTLIAAFAAVEKDKFLATIGGLVTFGLAGEKAAQQTLEKPGSFHVALYDAIFNLSLDDILKEAKVEIV